MTLNTVSRYTGLITCEHQDAPNYMAVIALCCQPFVDAQAFLASLPAAFGVQTAIGVQLDVVGQWVGVSRTLPVPVANVWAACDIAGVGCDQGYIYNPAYTNQTLLTSLDDDTYRSLILAKIAANNADGTVPNIQAILDSFFQTDGTVVFVQDEGVAITSNSFVSLDSTSQGLDGPAVLYYDGATVSTLPSADLAVTIGVAGKTPSIVMLEILAQGLLPVVSAGVYSKILVSSIDGAPLVGLDIDNQYIGGLDSAGLGVAPAILAGDLTGEFI